MRPSETIARQRRDLQLARQEAMDLRVALVECLEALVDLADYMGLSEDSPSGLAMAKARIALGVASPEVKS